ncbi:hypothetical protein [Neptunomonas phycophila]|uniref:hypothetical protein n=1 Tax=Neptunomonas phycophila TaxID=1572645 RepID=UPI003736DB35
MGEEYEVTTIGDWDDDLTFELDEAFNLMYQEVIAVTDLHLLPSPPIERIGIVIGVTHINNEVELLVRFSEGIENLIKTQFCGDFVLLEKLISLQNKN